MTSLTYIDDLVVDENGEIVSWPGDAPDDGPGRIGYLIGLERSAADAEEAFATAKRNYRFVVGRLLAEAGVKGLQTEHGNATRVAEGEMKVADALKVADATGAELMTATEAMDLLIRAAKALDVHAVEGWLDGIEGERRETLRAVLITRRPRAGYVRITPPTRKPPRIRSETPDLTPALQESIEAERMTTHA